jgi:hypothetical protein
LISIVSTTVILHDNLYQEPQKTCNTLITLVKDCLGYRTGVFTLFKSIKD